MSEHLFVSATPPSAVSSSTVVPQDPDPVRLAEQVARAVGQVRHVDVGGAAWDVAAAITGARMAGRDPRRVRWSVGPTTGPWAAAAADGRMSTVLVSSTGLPFPFVCGGVAFGGAVGLLGRGPDPVGPMAGWAAAFDRAPEHGEWTFELDGAPLEPAPWGVVVTASRHVGIGTAHEAFADGRLAVGIVDPSAGGGLLGLLRGADALLQRAEVRPAERVLVRGVGRVSIDGVVCGHSTEASSWVVEAGPNVSLLPRDPR